MHQHDRIQHHFNSHPHKEDDGLCASVWFCMLISTHILTKRMTTHDRLSVPHQSHFNSHPHEEDDYLFAHLLALHHHFNSHPHEEDDIVKGFCCLCRAISTHILTKRMTFISTPFSGGNYISTHILTKRMTNISNIQICWIIISTHILTKRMT